MVSLALWVAPLPAISSVTNSRSTAKRTMKAVDTMVNKEAKVEAVAGAGNGRGVAIWVFSTAANGLLHASAWLC